MLLRAFSVVDCVMGSRKTEQYLLFQLEFMQTSWSVKISMDEGLKCAERLITVLPQFSSWEGCVS